ncbi:putative transcriptional regulatory protein C3C7.04 [Lasiodiplodia hormozganensis]|uniref:Transcriptional regulatory protein C3C7.04 n=1 Tax=Lasiodiplodia hormozganensis TaxID=869390 RepID=A0AA39Y2M7_9PEZI|nr:putative transcriptional regulatory protein C3C7.04 [Lasiodiplodia hormozganensis]
MIQKYSRPHSTPDHHPNHTAQYPVTNIGTISPNSIHLHLRPSLRHWLPHRRRVFLARQPSTLENDNLVNSLVSSEPQIKTKKNGKARYLGHSSTLCFSQTVKNLLHASTTTPSAAAAPTLEREDTSYQTACPPIRLDLAHIDLPPLDFAEYLATTVCFYAEPLYHLFDKAAFIHRLHLFYDARTKGIHEQPDLWHIQMLLVFAFGKSVLAREQFAYGPAGSSYFARALEALPDVRRLNDEPVLAVEIACLVTLFMHAADMLQEAYVYIGQARRMCVLQQLNKVVEDVAQRPPDYERRRRLWWTVYCIDRKSAALLGTPSVMRDDDVCMAVPRMGAADFGMQRKFAIHIALSSQLGKILDVIYGCRGQRGRHFVQEVQAILSNLADTSKELAEHLKLELQRPIDIIPRKAATLHLLLHQCVILAVRPVLYSLLKVRLSSPAAASTFSSPVNALLKICVESAISTLRILVVLKFQTQCDLFLPYDVEALFSAASALIIIDILQPPTTKAGPLWDLPQVQALLDEFISRGIVPAKSFKADLTELLQLQEKVRMQRGVDTTTSAATQGRVADPGASPLHHGGAPDSGAAEQRDRELRARDDEDAIWAWIADDDGSVGAIHPDTITSAIDSLNYTNEFEMPDEAGFLTEDWMWSFESDLG